MEHLLALFNKVSQVSPVGVFEQEVVVVQNAGMQHWLNLALANERSISMNIRYALPAQFLWKLIRTIASDDKVPEQSPYSREVLTWRIYDILALETIINDKNLSEATHYWNSQHSLEHSERRDDFKRYQLAKQLADLFEQYLIFRPDWLDAWEKGKPIDGIDSKEYLWQAKIWQMLVKHLPYNPVELLEDAIANIQDNLQSIPKKLSFFGINTMAPMWLSFINALSEHIDVHFYHLNPCFDYWGDIKSEKQAFKQLSLWTDGVQHLDSFVGNPLLANLGQQGREFISMLQEYSTVNVDAFDDITIAEEQLTQPVLQCVQQDILSLTDARESPREVSEDYINDNSIVVTSSHSVLREVQGLHDYLLNLFNEDPSLTPKDILVMCPQIEQYAPFVNAVFTHGWQDVDSKLPPLPCSIADRSALNSDPIVSTFIELLSLPDSRFQVSQIVSLLRLPALADAVNIPFDSLDKIKLWLNKASVHWGVDKAHKAQYVGEVANNSFTWQQGLSRLIRGFAFSSEDTVYQDQLLLGLVEGEDAVLLGQLILFIEQLQQFSRLLIKDRTPAQWHQFLLSQLETLFDQQSSSHYEQSFTVITDAIVALVENCEKAGLTKPLPLAIVVEFLTEHFNQGDSSKQFMVGQVTFCSMLPMRSIPFKVIAVLGLNDGEYPRQRQPLGFDLLSISAARMGDRSRRADDRYLFLEAIISAREVLYLSYQGRSIRTNKEKQPSLVLKELMEYLSTGYGWHFTTDESDTDDSSTANKLFQLPMQAFSQDNFHGERASFDQHWLTLALSKNTQLEGNNLVISQEDTVFNSLTVDELARFYQHPAKYFAQSQLNLYFQQNSVTVDDVEPFTSDYLESYLLKQTLVSSYLNSNEGLSSEQIVQQALLSGKFPDLPLTIELLSSWQQECDMFATMLDSFYDSKKNVTVDCNIDILSDTTKHKSEKVMLSCQLQINTDSHVVYRYSTAKAKDLFTLYLQQLIVQIWQLNPSNNDSPEEVVLQSIKRSTGFYFNTKTQKIEQYTFCHLENPLQQLSVIIDVFTKGNQQALLLNGELAHAVFQKKRGKVEELSQEKFTSIWQGNHLTPGLGEDEYIHYFWQNCPDISLFEEDLSAVYQAMYQQVSKEIYDIDDSSAPLSHHSLNNKGES